MAGVKREHFAVGLPGALGRRPAGHEQHAEFELPGDPPGGFVARAQLGFEESKRGCGRSQRGQAAGGGDGREEVGGDAMGGPVLGKGRSGIPTSEFQQDAEFGACSRECRAIA